MIPASRICLASARTQCSGTNFLILEIEVKVANVIQMDNLHIQAFMLKWNAYVFQR